MSFSFGRLADYFHAVAELGAADDPGKQKAIAELLGLTAEAALPAPEIAVTPSTVPPAEPRAPEERARPEPPQPQHDPRRSRRPSPVAFTLRPTPVGERTAPEWIEHVPPLAPPPAVAGRPDAPEPLFTKRLSRSILSTAIATLAETNTIDIDAILEAAGRGQAIRRVPRKVVPTLARGTQVLVDRGPASAPFRADQDLLVEQIRAVAGRDRVQIVRFDPSRGFKAGAGARHEWRDYFDRSKPLHAVTIVLITDLGAAPVPLGSGALEDAWRDFVDRLRGLGNPLVAFVPYGRRRWPESLRGRLPIVPWDRRTSVQVVRRALGRFGRPARAIV